MGLAPMTSMYFHGENQRATGRGLPARGARLRRLAIQTGNGEWIWRPLVNPRRLLVTSFAVTDPRGFGLVQRDRAFGSYEDLEARYELRPSVWVEPVGSWGAGRVELVQIPTPDETNDNIVAYWVPQQALRPGVAVRVPLPADVAEGHRTAPARRMGRADTARPGLRGAARRRQSS